LCKSNAASNLICYQFQISQQFSLCMPYRHFIFSIESFFKNSRWIWIAQSPVVHGKAAELQGPLSSILIKTGVCVCSSCRLKIVKATWPSRIVPKSRTWILSNDEFTTQKFVLFFPFLRCGWVVVSELSTDGQVGSSCLPVKRT
jgi:hypothetical protein